MLAHSSLQFAEKRWADAFLNEGSMLFRSLAYFRDYEDEEVRGDTNEGTAVVRPEHGLEITNETQWTSLTLPDSSFESGANPSEIFVYCLGKSRTDEMRRRFRAVACVEILDVRAFCRNVEHALPAGSSFGGRPGHQRIGQHVQYYRATDSASRRWALPDVIASSKLASFAWQDEFRLSR
jgi:hypothetical protein